MPREIEEQDLERAVGTLLDIPTVTIPPSIYVSNSVSSWELGHDDILLQAGECNTSVKEIMNRIYALEIEVHELKEKFKQQGGFCL